MKNNVLHKRAAGILLAVSSLPSPYGIGSFGQASRRWLRFLKAAGQKYWQILPLGPTGWGDSPYQSFSAYAISSYYIDLDALIEDGLLAREEAQAVHWGGRAEEIDYNALYCQREKILRLACGRLRNSGGFDSFRAQNAFWLDDYSLFMALKKENNDRPWSEWSGELKRRDESSLGQARTRLANDIYYYSFTQYLAWTQWRAIRDYARELGIAIIGDMPIYVAADSADVWANSDLFLLDENLRPLRVAGCPPDPFSATGQLWGNPLYRWDRVAETGFAWWITRLRAGFDLCDVMRIDHFRGFESYFSIDANASDAAGGQWVKGPGIAFVDAVNRGLEGAAIIAEDLGYLTAEVKALLEASGYPGMKVLQFAFDSREQGDYIPYTYDRNNVVYTGTHDNPTTLGWFKSAPQEDTAFALEFIGAGNIKEGVRAFIRCALSCAANTAIIPMQDYLGLDDRARMNTPSTLGGNNWRWRMLPDAASPALAEEIKKLTVLYGR